MIFLEIDVYFESTIFEVLKEIEEFKGKIIQHEAVGPGGGNPRLIIQFPNETLAKEFLSEYDPDGDLEQYEVQY